MTQPYLILLAAIVLIGLDVISSHTHQLHMERTEDGAHSPRNHMHFQGGEHHTEFDHEAILGSTKDAEEFDHLPPEEAKRRLKILLTKIDRNSDEEIDNTELNLWILRSFRMLSSEESEERLDEVDTNEDGSVTWEEYIAETYGINSPEDMQALDGDDREKETRLMNEDRELFDAADRNSDGQLDKDEFLDFTHPEESPQMLPVILKQTLREKDSNGDGVLDFQEYIGNKGTREDREWLLTEKDKFDQDYDLDHNGFLDSSEILTWVAPSNEDISKDEVEHLFASADDDGDGILTFQEILEHHDIFVGSEATDYGDHLHNLDRFTDEL